MSRQWTDRESGRPGLRGRLIQAGRSATHTPELGGTPLEPLLQASVPPTTDGHGGYDKATILFFGVRGVRGFPFRAAAPLGGGGAGPILDSRLPAC